MIHKFYAPPEFIERRIQVEMLGAGGTGGEVLDAFARLHIALCALGHPGGVRLRLWDGDTVSAANIGRQRFGPSDIGRSKSIMLIQRYNMFFGFDWEAIPHHWTAEHADADTSADLIVSCVDRAAVRVEVARYAKHFDHTLWADFGNGASTGQFILGHISKGESATLRLPNVFDLHPELVTLDDSQEPSCSLAQALRSQDLFVNRMLADAGMAIVWNLLRGSIEAHGCLIDVRNGYVTPLHIDPTVWQSYGYLNPPHASVSPSQ